MNLKVAPGMGIGIDGALFLPEAWFADPHAHPRKRWGIPPALTFKSKPPLG